MTITAQPGGSFVDTDLSADLAAAALDLARKFHDGATLWVISPQWEPHAHHVAVEFVHPVIMGKRALPSVALVEPDPVAQARVAEPAGRPAARGRIGRRTRGARRDAPRTGMGCADAVDRFGADAPGGRREPHPVDRLRRPDGAGHRHVRADVPPAVGTDPRLLRAPGLLKPRRGMHRGRVRDLQRRRAARRGGAGAGRRGPARPLVRTANGRGVGGHHHGRRRRPNDLVLIHAGAAITRLEP